MRTFTINEAGVCVNPEIDFDIKNIYENFDGEFYITVAEQGGKWATAYKCEYRNKYSSLTGNSCLPCFDTKYRRCFNTRKEAILKQIENMLTWHDLPKPIQNALKNYRNSLIFEQLKLF